MKKNNYNHLILKVLYMMCFITVLQFFSIDVAIAEDNLGSSLIVMPKEPEWESVVTTDVSSTEEIQKLIDNAGPVPTKIILTKDVTRNGNTGAVGMSVLNISSNQKIYMTSENNSNFKIDVKFSEDKLRGVVYVEEKGELYLENITLTGGQRLTGGGGGILLGVGEGSTGGAMLVMKNGASVTENQSEFGGGVYISPGNKFYMNGGSIQNNTSSTRGGGVYAYHGGEFYMLDGNVSGNYGGSQGGNGVYADGSKNVKSIFKMNNGLITKNGSDSQLGEGVVLNNSVFDMTGGEISHHYGSGSGGGVGVIDSIFNMFGGQIKNNHNYYGGAVSILGSAKESGTELANCSIFNLYGGTIGGDSESEANTGSYPSVMIGNAARANQGGTFNMYGGKISYNKSDGDHKAGGGVAVTNYGVANISGKSEISYNQVGASGVGGGISVNYGELNISDEATISNNKASTGAGIAALSNAIVNFDNGIITSNVASANGGGIYLGVKSDFYLKNGLIEKNVTDGNGGGIIIANNTSRLFLDGGIISGNIAGKNGGGIFDIGYTNSDFFSIYLKENATVSFFDNKASKIVGNTEIPKTGEWNGKISKTSIDGSEFSGITKEKIDEYVQNGNDLNKLIVFNNYDINIKSNEFFYKIDFESNDGKKIPSQLISDSGKELVTNPIVEDREGYKFIGWFNDEELATQYDFSTPVTSDKVLYAKWEKEMSKIYNIKYVLNGGVNSEKNPKTYTYGEGVSSFEIPVREGYTFLGWTDKDGNKITSISTETTGDKTLYAKWEKKLSSKEKGKLPQAGEKNNKILIALGIVIVLICAGFFGKKIINKK